MDGFCRDVARCVGPDHVASKRPAVMVGGAEKCSGFVCSGRQRPLLVGDAEHGEVCTR